MSKASLRTGVYKRKWKGKKRKTTKHECSMCGRWKETWTEKVPLTRTLRAVTHLGRKTAGVYWATTISVDCTGVKQQANKTKVLPLGLTS